MRHGSLDAIRGCCGMTVRVDAYLVAVADVGPFLCLFHLSFFALRELTRYNV